MDILRFLSLLSVIAIHSFDTNRILHAVASKLEAWAVPEFIIISFFVTAHKLNKRKYIINRIKSLIFPYICFSILYLIIRLLKKYTLENFFDWSIVSHSFSILLFGGASGHLYYIPMYLLYLIIICFFTNHLVNFKLSKLKSISYITVISLICSLFLSYAINPLLKVSLSDPYLTSFIGYFSHYLPYPFIGIFIFYLYQSDVLNIGLVEKDLCKLSILSLIILIYICQFEYAFITRVILSSLIFLLALSFNRSLYSYKFTNLFTSIASLSIGVYLLHPLLIETNQLFLGKLLNIELDSFFITFSVWLFSGVIASYSLVFFYQKVIYERKS
ncbi:MAG: acyltransferase family protein [Rivularia sp. (in: Bacteria)]|nr:acyltransferase family protein [Rivularia sp. MS3]